MSTKQTPFARGAWVSEMTWTAWVVESYSWLRFCLHSAMQQFTNSGFSLGYQKNISMFVSYVHISQHCCSLCSKTYTQKNKSCVLRCPVNTKCLHNMRWTLYLPHWSNESEWRRLLVVLWHSKASNSSQCWQKNIYFNYFTQLMLVYDEHMFLCYGRLSWVSV